MWQHALYGASLSLYSIWLYTPLKNTIYKNTILKNTVWKNIIWKDYIVKVWHYCILVYLSGSSSWLLCISGYSTSSWLIVTLGIGIPPHPHLCYSAIFGQIKTKPYLARKKQNHTWPEKKHIWPVKNAKPHFHYAAPLQVHTQAFLITFTPHQYKSQAQTRDHFGLRSFAR